MRLPIFGETGYGNVNHPHPLIYGNTSGNNGGGINATNSDCGTGSTMHIYAGIIENNTANNNGGGISFGTNSFLTMDGGLIYNNTALNNGGGVNVARGAFDMYGGYIQGNTATNNGGGVFSNAAAAIFTMRGGTIGGARPAGLPAGAPNPYANTATDGGGVWVGGGASFYMLPSMMDDALFFGRIIGNIADGDGVFGGQNNSNGAGGGVRVQNDAQFLMQAGVIGGPTQAYANISNGGGGGVSVREAEFTMEQGAVTIHGANITTRGSILNNIAGVDGGGVWVSIIDTLFTMYNGEISDNHAYRAGGGVRMEHGSIFIMHDGLISDNIADLNGGGVSGGTSFFEMHDGLITRNESPSGGGVRMHSNTFTMTGGSITHNTAPLDTDGDFGYGGGVLLVDTVAFNMYAGTISYNEAVIGGGVYLSNNSTFNLRDTYNKVITNNQASRGGGVFVAELAGMRMVPGSSGGVSITHNAALGMGGGIYSEAFEYNNPLTRVTGPNMAYNNLTLYNVYFNHNTADQLSPSPVNALAVVLGNAFSSTSLNVIHPLNNYDINYAFIFNLPLTGGTGVAPFTMAGTAVLGIAFLLMVFIALNKIKAQKRQYMK